MELFIWNDYSWKIIEETVEYDKNEFFVVRKLFVQWPKQGGTEEYNDQIRQYFEVYGNIESVETVNGDPSNSEAGACADLAMDAAHNSNVHEVYVTCEQSKDAFNAFSANRYESKAIKVIPADTWHQPGVELDIPNMNLDVQQKCDDSSPTKLEVVISDLSKVSIGDQKKVCQHSTLHVSIDLDEWSLKRVREIFHVIKPHLHKLTLTSLSVMDPNDENCLSRDEFLARVAQILSVPGECFNDLTMNCPYVEFSIKMLDNFAPLLRRSETLILWVDGVNLCQLRDYCPNLVDLNVMARVWDDENPDAAVQHWPSLINLGLTGETLVTSDTFSGIHFHRFVEMNPQLEGLNLKGVSDNNLLKAIVTNLKNLKTLDFIQKTYEEIDVMLDLLDELKNLETLEMSTLKATKTTLDGMLKCAERFKQMDQLKMVTLFQNYEPDTEQPEHFYRLLACDVKYHNGCQCHGLKRVVEFEDGASSVTLPPNDSVLVVIVNSKNPEETADSTLAETIFSTLHATTAFYPKLIHQSMVNIEDRCQYYYVSHA